MPQSYTELSEALDRLEQQALDHPEQLFPLSYVRSHLDLLDAHQPEVGLTAALQRAVASTFDTDRMSKQDRAAVLQLIERLATEA